MTKLYRPFLLFFLPLLIGGCATLSPGFQQPEVEVTALEPMPPGPGSDLRFRIHLRVFNPNDTELALSGLYYTLSLAGHKVITGTSNDLPTIAAYGQGDIAVDATASLVGSLFAAAELIGGRSDRVPYELEAKLGLRRSIVPSIKVRRIGEVRLSPYL
ncbi:Late embryogenesis abundant protein [Microbulbifer thermotolerans]|uniref:LEA type 2 family protein n=1 Tax=Microbulbifer thermotolerans TaxID=252514 RepID=UPI0008E0F7BE|nr:LEA type 2 family protein [Microbulbifer thermotolerans]MCX2834410.1 LEA type 2 family protein [Microbulbifer thermotolerans]WKT61997.1 LEA type 2 family protein [Microbulbifer thermotolerans]SFC94411.1 Late embryogenesis abundant protein [Microbulbifer thermotolerans]